MSKVKLTLSVDRDLVEQAREHGINLSALFEVKLKEFLDKVIELRELKGVEK